MADKQNTDASERPIDCNVRQRIDRYLQQLAPHQKEREGPQLLREAMSEIERLNIGFERYETVRQLTPREWADAYNLNITTGKPLDEIIDDL